MFKKKINIYEGLNNVGKIVVQDTPITKEIGNILKNNISNNFNLQRAILDDDLLRLVDFRDAEQQEIVEYFLVDIKDYLEDYLNSLDINFSNELIEDITNLYYLGDENQSNIRNFISQKLETLDKKQWLKILPQKLARQMQLIVFDLLDVEGLPDKIGDEITLLTAIDCDEREKAFVYLDGEIVWGEESESHIQTVNNYCMQNNLAQLEEDYYRDAGLKEIKRKNLFTDMAFGHYAHGVAFIEGRMFGNATLNEVKDKLLNQTDEEVTKIYKYNDDDTAIRIANKVQK